MRRNNHLLALLAGAAASAVTAMDGLLPSVQAAGVAEWVAVADVDTVQIRIHWVSREELVAAARRVGQRASTQPLGFSVLARDVETGRFYCDIYMPERPKRLNDRATGSLGHELSHCLGYSHD